MLDTFDGSRGKDPEEWLEQYERVATFNRWEMTVPLKRGRKPRDRLDNLGIT